ncbi:MAG TPA: 4Fe-4S dicluster-binding protein [Nitrososphaerales archaeon]|nr:4Fe-4S dicluster-binding protein [Nitrososphaerales archaeon]
MASVKRIEINYRGIFQKQLAKKIANYVVYVAHSEGKVAFSNGRYSDSPERNGVPCKYFTFVSSDLTEGQLEAVCGSKMDIESADVSVVLDDTMVKGVEPWAWHGIRPVNEKIGPGGKMIVVTTKSRGELVRFLGRKPFAYDLALLEGEASFSGLWVFKDDSTDVRVLGAIARADPGLVSIKAVEAYTRSAFKGEKAKAARLAHDSLLMHRVEPSEGIDWPHAPPRLPSWKEMREGLVVPAVSRAYAKGPRGQSRSTTYLRGTTKSARPVVRFDLCTKCTLCWLECPDECFDPTTDGLFDVNYDYCTGCGKCAQVCPVEGCIVMVDELRFDNNDSPWERYKIAPEDYVGWAKKSAGGDYVLHNVVTGTGVRRVKVPEGKGKRS